MLHLESMLELFERYFNSVSDVILFKLLKQSSNLFDRFDVKVSFAKTQLYIKRMNLIFHIIISPITVNARKNSEFSISDAHLKVFFVRFSHSARNTKAITITRYEVSAFSKEKRKPA